MTTATIATISTGGKNVFTPRVKNEAARLSFFISDADMAKITRGPGLKGVVTDLVTGAKYSVKGASCGSKHCYCDAIAKQVTPTWAEYQMSRATDEVMQAAIKEVAQMLEAGEITEARADELIDFIR